MYSVDENECTGCGICLDSCPAGAITIGEWAAVIDQAICTSCGACCEACSQNAIYEVVHAPLSRSPALTASAPVARRAPATVTLRTNRLTREEKAAALATVLPALSRILVRLAERFLSRGDGGFHSGGIVKSDYGRLTGQAGRGRHRWRGGS